MIESRLPYSEVMRVRYSDSDSQGHLYFANYMVFADEVAGHFMEELGYTSALSPQHGPALVFTVNINCDYQDECKAGDKVRVFVGYQRLGNSSAVLAYEIYNDGTGEALAKGTITQVYVDHDTRKSRPIPPDFRAAIVQRQPELA